MVSKKFKGVLTIAVTGLVVIAAVAVFFLTRVPAVLDDDPAQAYISLNDTLDNSLSDLPGFEDFDRKIESWIKFWDIKGV